MWMMMMMMTMMIRRRQRSVAKWKSQGNGIAVCDSDGESAVNEVWRFVGFR